ncbi:hypothetical protein [Parageobacillus thermoglucosidasius]|uniref:Uncharacterized protein n=3 Tax=Bacillales TaxID=1385 RepID=A0A7U4DK12_GEOS0|nr:hypothetical protein [Parageobacillus thermoglucosidasius]MED4903988.1 hypothetical protein [Parageobacillus thermoglucosidasius]MED4914110.1 hypothetical protein [Parageobacillus thermoglucosidasius]MED4946781.1 hypothetical protein [Parageobacillus thermoglucosidasius]MED4984878.1 hypothetical protein [Parageobacillus thermoglucosidasius]
MLTKTNNQLRLSMFVIISSLVLVFSTLLAPLKSEAVTSNDIPDHSEINSEITNIVIAYTKFDEKKNKIVITNKKELKEQLNLINNAPSYKEVVSVIEKFNKVINSAEGENLKKSILEEVNTQNNNIVSIQKISGCGAASIAGFAHTTAFTGLMTLAGISGPAGWAIGTGVAAVWLGASAAAGCLR